MLALIALALAHTQEPAAAGAVTQEPAAAEVHKALLDRLQAGKGLQLDATGETATTNHVTEGALTVTQDWRVKADAAKSNRGIYLVQESDSDQAFDFRGDGKRMWQLDHDRKEAIGQNMPAPWLLTSLETLKPWFHPAFAEWPPDKVEWLQSAELGPTAARGLRAHYAFRPSGRITTEGGYVSFEDEPDPAAQAAGTITAVEAIWLDSKGRPVRIRNERFQKAGIAGPALTMVTDLRFAHFEILDAAPGNLPTVPEGYRKREQ